MRIATENKKKHSSAPDRFVDQWVLEAIQEAYGRGRYDEASAETFDMVT